MTKVIASVTNDLIADQRLHKVCTTLSKANYEVLLVGRRMNESPEVIRLYETKRMKLLFNRGPLFYVAYNIRLFFFLLFTRCDILVANDLDTLLANFLVSKIKGIPLIYDTHEYFCGMPELADRPFVRSYWLGIERSIFPKLKHILTVNESVAKLYEEEYGKQLTVIKNYPRSVVSEEKKSRQDLGLPEGKKIILYQGAVNVDRGMEEAAQAMSFVDNAILVIIGGGNALKKLERFIESLGNGDKILLKGRLPFNELVHYTRQADLGLAIEKDTNLNYKFSLSNKVFDYIHGGVPILSSKLIENVKIIEEWKIGAMIDSHDPAHIAEQINFMLENESLRETWKTNLQKAKANFTWEDQESTLLRVYDQIQLR